MTTIRERWNVRRRELNWIALYAGVVGVLSILLDVVPAADGEVVAISRIAVAVLGMTGAAMLWWTPGGNLGWVVLATWAAVQVPMIAWSPLGSPTEQFFAFPLGYSKTTTVNGVVTDFEQYAVNIVGVALTAVVIKYRDELRRGWRTQPTLTDRR